MGNKNCVWELIIFDSHKQILNSYPLGKTFTHSDIK